MPQLFQKFKFQKTNKAARKSRHPINFFNRNKISMHTLFFINRFVQYLLLLLLPLGLVSAYSLYYLNSESRKSAESANRNMLYQLKSELDTVFDTSKRISSYLSSDLSLYSALCVAFTEDPVSRNSIKGLQSVGKYLSSAASSSKYDPVITLYLSNPYGRTVTASDVNYYTKLYAQENPLESFYDSKRLFWCEASSEVSSDIPDTLTTYQIFFSGSTFDTKKHMLLVSQYDMNSLREYVNQLELIDDQVLFLFKNDGSILFQSDTEGTYEGLWNLLPLSSLSNGYLNCELTYQSVSCTVTLSQSDNDDYFYLSLVPTSQILHQAHNLRRIFFLVAAISILTGSVLALWSAGKDIKQLLTLADVFEDPDANISAFKGQSPAITNPYQLIMRNIVRLFIEHQYMQVQIDNKQYQIQLLELQALQHQINPHFIYNTLNTIYWESIRFTGQPNSCSDMISDLTEIISFALSNKESHVPVKKELSYLQHYINIQKNRYKDKFDILLDVEEETLSCPILKMTLQPLVENAIYHGIKEIQHFGLIKIRIYRKENALSIQIIDNGIGIPKEKLILLQDQLKNAEAPDNHIGLLNTNRRLVLSYGKEAAIHLYSHYQMATLLSFALPLEAPESNA